MEKIGIVQAVGEETEHYDMDIRVGDEILYKERPNAIEVEKFKLIELEDVLLVHDEKRN